VILFNLCGHGHFDMSAYSAYFTGELEDLQMPEEELASALERLPRLPPSPDPPFGGLDPGDRVSAGRHTAGGFGC
jgi:hypothetical protein